MDFLSNAISYGICETKLIWLSKTPKKRVNWVLKTFSKTSLIEQAIAQFKVKW